MSDLKACPFCGKQPEAPVDATRILGVWRIFHHGCPSLPNIVLEAGYREAVIADWNRRAPSPAVLALVEACRNLFDEDCNPPMPNTSRAVALYTDVASALYAVEKEIG